MDDSSKHSPFSEADVEEVHLEDAPLLRVLSQIVWPELITLRDEGFNLFVNAFSSSIASEFPIRAEPQNVAFQLGPNGPIQQQGQGVYRFTSVDDAWSVYLSPTFVTLETTSYSSRVDFCARLTRVLTAVLAHTEIPRIDRLGFRYTNRVDAPSEFIRLSEWVDPIVLGGRSVPGAEDVRIHHSISETQYVVRGMNLTARWATLPPGGSFDPTLQASPHDSWTLDLDAFTETKMAFEPTAIVSEASRLSALGYNFFRWAVNDKFLVNFGGDREHQS